MTAADKFTHIDNSEDIIYLRRKLFPVNMRLFKSSLAYRRLIGECCRIIKCAALTKYDDYKKPHGMSGANLAIPFNIIGIVIDRNTGNERVKILINPKFKAHTPILHKECITNCGSIRLNNPIKIKRPTSGTVSYYDELGKYNEEFIIEGLIYTIQHEIDHNNGILITDHQSI